MPAGSAPSLADGDGPLFPLGWRRSGPLPLQQAVVDPQFSLINTPLTYCRDYVDFRLIFTIKFSLKHSMIRLKLD